MTEQFTAEQVDNAAETLTGWGHILSNTGKPETDNEAGRIGAMLRAYAALLRQQEAVSKLDEWVWWGGGDCPVHPSCCVVVRLRDGSTSMEAVTASVWLWTHSGNEGDIIAYRIVETDND